MDRRPRAVGRGARTQRARFGAALALILLAAAAPAQESPAFDLPFELPEDLAGRSEFVAALRSDDGQRAASEAYGLVQELIPAGRLRTAAELLEFVTARFEPNRFTPLLLAVLGDLKRAQGSFEEALELFDRSDALPGREEDLYLLIGRSRSAGARGQTLLDLGLLKPAQLAFKEIDEHNAALNAALRSRGAHRSAAQVDLGAAYYRCNVDLALGLDSIAERSARALLDGEALRESPDQLGRVRLLIGTALLGRARSVLDEAEASGVDELLARASLELEQALEGDLSYEERFKAQVTLVDVCWLSGDTRRERDLLRSVYADEVPQVEPAWLGDRAAFRVRRQLEDARMRAPLTSALDGLATILVDGLGEAWGLPRPTQGQRPTLRAWGALREGVGHRQLAAAGAELERVFEEVRSAWMRAPRPNEGIGFMHWDQQLLLVGAWVRVLVELHGPERGAELALEAVSRAHSICTLLSRLAPGAVRQDAWRTWRASLPADAGALVLLPSMDSTHLLALDAERVTHEEVAVSRTTLSRLAHSVAGYVRNLPGPDEDLLAGKARADSRALGDALLPPTIRQRMASWSSVTVVGAELLGDPCLEWLEFDGQLFGERFGTSYLPSLDLAEVLVERLQGRDFDPRDAVVVAASGPPCARPVDLTTEELSNLRRLADGDLREGARADLTGDLGRGVLAVVAHGEYLSRELRPAHLVLASGAVGCGALERAELPPLVCLLACGAARGPVLPGDDGAVHLGGAALVGGAGAVLLARNDVEAAASLALFELFMDGLKGGAPPDEALRRARTALPELRGEWRHPFYTQSLSLFGLGRFPVR